MSERFYLRSLTIATVTFALALAACGDDGTRVQTVSSVTVSPGSTTLVSVGATAQLSANARDADGATVEGAAFTWGSSDGDVATVDVGGLVTAVSDGTATISATTEGGTGSATVRVAQEASSIFLEIAADTIPAGGTTSVTARVEDAGGSNVATPDLAWSSSDDGVATVDGDGMVTGIAEGEATIRAAQDGADASVEVVVIRQDVAIVRDTTVGGVLAVGELSVADDVVVTLASDVVIDATGSVDVAGTVQGDCTALTLEGGADVTVSGTLRNACVAVPMGGPSAPPLRVTAPGPIVLDESLIESSGPITVTSTGGGAAAVAGPRRAASSEGVVSMVGSTVRADPATAPDPPDAASTSDGADVRLEGESGIRLNGTTVRAQHGAPGLPVSETSSASLEVGDVGAGGDGGDIELVRGEEGRLYFSNSRGRSELVAGNGAPSGPVTATATQNDAPEVAPSATAYGEEGGYGGSVVFLGSAVAVFEDGTPDLGDLVAQPGRGGRGANATAVAADGVPANATRSAQPGGDARATAGIGGPAGAQEGSLFDTQARGERRAGGGGGNASAQAGRGGDGSLEGDPDGADGGDGRSVGGDGGPGYRQLGGIGGSGTTTGGDGGHGVGACPMPEQVDLSGEISVASDPAGSDPFIFGAGAGTALELVVRFLAEPGGPGGSGGDGGLLSGQPGLGGRNSLSLDRAETGSLGFGPGGNGGDGGEGTPGGPGGAPGVGDPRRVTPILVDDVFVRGADGPDCELLAVAGRAPRSPGVRAFVVVGDAPWVDVDGTWDDETGVVTATGRGPVAGVPDVLVEFEGTWDPATRTLTGTYTIDSEKKIVPDHP
ncbi:MAG: Ig-like domain-containing protein, partial [Gemmatimonadota bacterium]